jgi:hypothetical protein
MYYMYGETFRFPMTWWTWGISFMFCKLTLKIDYFGD